MSELQWHPTIDHVCYSPEAVRSEYEDLDQGWYFTDETEGLNGPYETAEAAKEALDEYTENLL